jgi:hypothetical protein
MVVNSTETSLATVAQIGTGVTVVVVTDGVPGAVTAEEVTPMLSIEIFGLEPVVPVAFPLKL